MLLIDADRTANSVDPDQTAPAHLSENIRPHAGPGVERIGGTPQQSVKTWSIGVQLVCHELRPVSLEEKILVIEHVDMQHITSALISARQETMRARVWSVGFVVPSPRDNLCFAFSSFSFVSSLIPTMFPFTFFVICVFIPRRRQLNGSIV